MPAKKNQGELVLTTPDGKFSVKLSVRSSPNYQLTVSAQVAGQHGKPVDSIETPLAAWSLQSGKLERHGS